MMKPFYVLALILGIVLGSAGIVEARGGKKPSAALPSNELWREALTDQVVGFGKNTTGGKGGDLCQVTNLTNSGTGSLRACAEAVGAKWITFSVSGTIALTTTIHIKSNKTIDGRGQNIVVSGKGLVIGSMDTVNPGANIIVHNITIKNPSGDGIGIGEDIVDIWIDHVTFDSPGDESIFIGSSDYDAGNGLPPSAITISWNHFLKGTCGAGYCIGTLISKDSVMTRDAAITATFHHNHYQTWVRQPFVRFATVHSFNNYVNKPNVGIEARTGAKVYSENDIFERETGVTSNPMCKSDGGQAWTNVGDSPAANMKCLNPWLINGATIQERNASTIFNPSSFYSYTAETANAALQTKIINTAGRQNSASLPGAPTNLQLIP